MKKTIEVPPYKITIKEDMHGARVDYQKGSFSNDTGRLSFESIMFIEEDKSIINGPRIPRQVEEALAKLGYVMKSFS